MTKVEDLHGSLGVRALVRQRSVFLDSPWTAMSQSDSERREKPYPTSTCTKMVGRQNLYWVRFLGKITSLDYPLKRLSLGCCRRFGPISHIPTALAIEVCKSGGLWRRRPAMPLWPMP